MLLRLLRTYLAPYKPSLALIVLLQFVGTVAALYLPSLNADIIDQGVAEGDTDDILRTGGIMLVVSLVQILCSVTAVWFAARTAMALRPRRPSGDLPPGRFVLPARGPALRRALADHPRAPTTSSRSRCWC